MTGPRLLFLLLVVLAGACTHQEAPVTLTRTAMAAVEMGTATRATPTRQPTGPITLSPTPAGTATAMATATAMPAPTKTARPTATAIATPTTAVWVEAGTPPPASGAVISPENATAITELARWGRGVIRDIDLAADGRRLAVAAGAAVYVHDTEALDAPPVTITTTNNVTGVSLSPAGDVVALALEGPEVQLWQVEPLQMLYAKMGARDPQFSSDGRALAVNNGRGIEVWDGESGEAVAFFRVPYPAKSKFSPNSEQIAVWENYDGRDRQDLGNSLERRRLRGSYSNRRSGLR